MSGPGNKPAKTNRVGFLDGSGTEPNRVSGPNPDPLLTLEKRDAYHQDEFLWGKGITDMVARVVAATERDQREERKSDTEGVGLDASIHADLMQTGGLKKPEERKQPQPGRQLKLKPKPNPKPNPAPTPTPTPTPIPRAASTSKGVTTSVPTPTQRCVTSPP